MEMKIHLFPMLSNDLPFALGAFRFVRASFSSGTSATFLPIGLADGTRR
jgi:hypothetical protein